MRWIAFLLATPAFALGPILPAYLPADTKIVIGVDVRRILDSPLAKDLASHVQLPAVPILNEIDFFKDVDQVLIAANSASAQSSGLMVMKGRFHGTGVQTDPKYPNSMLAILDESTALAGETKLVQAALARRAKSASGLAALEARVEPLAAKYDIWGAGEMEGEGDFSFGASLRQGLDAVAEIRLRSAAEMAKLNEFIKPVEAMLKSQAASSKFNVHTSGNTLHFSLAIPEEELKKAIVAQKAALTQAMLAQFAAPKPKAKTEGKIEKDSKGDTVRVVLPGGE